MGNDDILMAVAERGGIDTHLENDLDGRLSQIKTPFGVTNLVRPGKGRSPHDLAESLLPLGYLTKGNVGNGVDAHELLDLLERAASDEEIMSNHMDVDKHMAREAQEEAEDRATFDEQIADKFLKLYPELHISYLDTQEIDCLLQECYAPD